MVRKEPLIGGTVMQVPPLDADTLFEQFLQALPPAWDALAREYKAFTRSRKIKTPLQLLRLVLLYCGVDQSLREVAGTLTLLGGAPLTDSAILTRLKACEPWLKALLPRLLPALPAGVPQLRAIKVIDGSALQGPGATQTWYRLHLCLDLVTVRFTQVQVTDVTGGESLQHFALQAGDIVLVDRGYNHPQVVVETVQRGVDLVLRLNPYSMPLFAADGTALDLMAELQRQPAALARCLPVAVGPSKSPARVCGWLHAQRLPPAQAAAARRRCRANAKGKTPSAKRLFLAEWVLVWTSMPPTELATETVLALYRLRWQVELAIKRWKSLLNVDKLRSQAGGVLLPLWLHGKLLYALLLEQRGRGCAGEVWGYLDRERQATWWRPWKLMVIECTWLITGVAFWQAQRWSACLAALRERPRRRQLHTIPAAARRLLLLASIATPTGLPVPIAA
jgi:hypothetical protein